MSRSRSASPARSFENERNMGMAPKPAYGGGGFGGGRIPRSEELFSIKVDNMSLRTNKDDVRSKFDRFGEIGDIFFPSDKMTGSSRGFCFVRYFKEESMEDALEYFKDGFEWDDRKVMVEKSTPRPRPGTDSWDPDRRGRGGFGGGDRGRGFGGRGGGQGGGRARAEDLFSCKVLDMSLRTTKDDVRAKFERFGEIGDLFFPPDRDTGASRGFCYVRYFKREHLEDAMDAYARGVEIDGQNCFVERAMPRGGGGFGGGRGGYGGGRDFGGRGRDFGDRGGRDFGDRGGYGDRGYGRDRFDDRRLDRFDERDRRDFGGFGRRERSPYGRRDSRSPPRRRLDSRSPPPRRSRSPRRRESPDDRYRKRRSPSADYDRYRRRSPLRSRSRSPYRR